MDALVQVLSIFMVVSVLTLGLFFQRGIKTRFIICEYKADSADRRCHLAEHQDNA